MERSKEKLRLTDIVSSDMANKMSTEGELRG